MSRAAVPPVASGGQTWLRMVWRRVAWYLGLCVWPALALAQPPADPEWQEAVVTPPAFQTERLQTFPVSVNSSMVFGLDPATLSVGPDYVVRYVVVARSGSGALNALFEGVRCKTAEVRTYARWDNNRALWNAAQSGWQPLSSVRHAARLAAIAFCDGNAVTGNPQQILQALRRGSSEPTR